MCQNLLKGINKSASVTKAKVQKIVKTSHDVKMDKTINHCVRVILCLTGYVTHQMSDSWQARIIFKFPRLI